MKILKEEIIKLGTVFGVGMARISDSDLLDAIVSQGDLSDTDISHKKFDKSIERRSLKNIWFNRSNLTQSNLTGFPVYGCEFRAAIMEMTCLSKAEIVRCDFREAKLLDANLRSAVISYCNFSGADLRHCDFSNCTIAYSDFRGAKLQGACFKGTSFEVAVFDRQWRIKNGMMVRA